MEESDRYSLLKEVSSVQHKAGKLSASDAVPTYNNVTVHVDQQLL